MPPASAVDHCAPLNWDRRCRRGHDVQMLRRSVLIVLCLVLLAACSSGGDKRGQRNDAADVTDENAGRADSDCDGTVESPDPTFVVDRCGRVLILRGVNVESSAKGDAQTDRHLPASPLGDQAALGKWGWNVVRFLVFWGAIEPEPGHYDESLSAP